MRVRLTALLLAIVLCTMGLWWLHTQVMPHQAWASHGDHWTLTAIGWKTLLYAWPVSLAGLIVGGLAGLVAGGWLGNQAAKLDLAEQHQAAQQAQAVARAAEQDTRQAQARADQARYAATLAEEQANRRQAAADARVTAAEARSATISAQARVAIAEAEKRRRNAAGAAERRRRQLERFQSGTPQG